MSTGPEHAPPITDQYQAPPPQAQPEYAPPPKPQQKLNVPTLPAKLAASAVINQAKNVIHTVFYGFTGIFASLLGYHFHQYLGAGIAIIFVFVLAYYLMNALKEKKRLETKYGLDPKRGQDV